VNVPSYFCFQIIVTYLPHSEEGTIVYNHTNQQMKGCLYDLYVQISCSGYQTSLQQFACRRSEMKWKVVLHKHQAMKVYKGNGGKGKAPRIPNLFTRWSWVSSFTLQLFFPRHPMDRRLDEPQCPSGRDGEKKPTPAGNYAPVIKTICHPGLQSEHRNKGNKQ